MPPSLRTPLPQKSVYTMEELLSGRESSQHGSGSDANDAGSDPFASWYNGLPTYSPSYDFRPSPAPIPTLNYDDFKYHTEVSAWHVIRWLIGIVAIAMCLMRWKYSRQQKRKRLLEEAQRAELAASPVPVEVAYLGGIQSPVKNSQYATSSKPYRH